VRTVGDPVNNRLGFPNSIAAARPFCQIEATDGSSGTSVELRDPAALGLRSHVTTRYERLKMQRRMQRRIRMVVEERRMAFADRQPAPAQPAVDPEATMEIPPPAIRAIARVAIRPA
jgi:hypothetical protein